MVPAGTLAWVRDRVWGLQELSWQTSAFPAQEHPAGMDSLPLLPGLLLLGQLWELSSAELWAVLCLQLGSCKFREEVKEGKQNRICLKSKPFDAGIA